MKILNKQDILNNKDFYIKEIKGGKTFIYPTDTVYGIGCDATNDKQVQRIYEIKKRCSKPCLIIVPNEKWIRNNLEITEIQINEMKEKFLTQHSFVVKLKTRNPISKYTNNNQETIGIRHPNNWFTQIIKEANLPFITTSVNYSGKPSATKIEEIPKEILNQVDYIIKDDSSMTGKPSTIINLVNNEKLR